jgi:hypothetical protein
MRRAVVAISGPRYLVLEAVYVADGQWTTDLAAKPNCYLSERLATARAAELTEDALRQGQARAFRVQRSNGAPSPAPAIVQGHEAA